MALCLDRLRDCLYCKFKRCRDGLVRTDSMSDVDMQVNGVRDDAFLNGERQL